MAFRLALLLAAAAPAVAGGSRGGHRAGCRSAWVKGTKAVCFSSISNCDKTDEIGWTNFVMKGKESMDLWAGASQCDAEGAALAGSASIHIRDDGIIELDVNTNSAWELQEASVWLGLGKLPQRWFGRYTADPERFPYQSGREGIHKFRVRNGHLLKYAYFALHVEVCPAEGHTAAPTPAPEECHSAWVHGEEPICFRGLRGCERKNSEPGGWTNAMAHGVSSLKMLAGAESCEADGAAEAGSVGFTMTESNVELSINMAAGWRMKGAAIWLGRDKLPKSIWGRYSGVPERFPYKAVKAGSYRFRFTGKAPSTLYFALHAEVCRVPRTLPPLTQAPKTGAPVTAVPPTPAPATPAPETGAPPTAAPPTAAPATSAPPTVAPATAAPSTAAPATSAPPTVAPATSAPPTVAPATAAPPTVAPATSAPPTAAPATSAPPTVAPATAAPPTAAPATSAPPTVAPATAAPPTVAPPTSAPPTVAPATSAPPTVAPATSAPRTATAVPSLPSCRSSGTVDVGHVTPVAEGGMFVDWGEGAALVDPLPAWPSAENSVMRDFPIKWVERGFKAYLPTQSSLDAASTLRIECPANCGMAPCEVIISYYECPPCSTRTNGGFPAMLPRAGWEAGHCSPTFRQEGGMQYFTMTSYRKLVPAGTTLETPRLSLPLQQAAVFVRQGASVCPADEAACGTTTGCMWLEGTCISDWCPGKVSAGGIGGSGMSVGGGMGVGGIGGGTEPSCRVCADMTPVSAAPAPQEEIGGVQAGGLGGLR